MVNISQRMTLVDALLECRHVREHSTRNSIVEQLPVALQSRIPRRETARADVLSIVEICSDWEGGLDAFIAVVRSFEGDGSIHLQRVQEVYDRVRSQSGELAEPQPPMPPGERHFTSLIQSFCERIGWRITEITDTYGLLEFEMPTGRPQIVLLIPYEDALEFSVPSELVLEPEDELFHELSTLLLVRNSQSKYCFWTIQELEGQHFYSCMHNATMELLDALYFRTVVEALLGEMDLLEQLLEEMSEEQPIGEFEEGPRLIDFRF